MPVSSIANKSVPEVKSVNGIGSLLAALQQGVLVLGVGGNIKTINAVATAELGEHAQQFASHVDVLSALRQCTMGKVKPPVTLRVELELGDGKVKYVDATITYGPALTDFGVILAAGASGGNDNFVANLIELLRTDLLVPAKSWMRSITALSASPDAAARDCVLRGADTVSRLGKLIDIVELFGTEAIAIDDRVEIEVLVRAAWTKLSDLARQRRIQLSLTGFAGDLPPIYGNRRLLGRVFEECLENAIIHSREDAGANGMCNVEMHASISGSHMLLAVRNYGAGLLREIDGRIFLPFNQAAVSADRRAAPPAAGHAGLGLGLPLCKRILEIHGGFLREESTHDDTTAMVIQLPTGAPQRDQTKLDIAQAQCYASDIAKLMARRNAAAK